MKISMNYFVFLLLSFFGLMIATINPFILSRKFYADALLIVNDFNNEAGFSSGSYGITMLFYKVTGLKYLHFSIIAFLEYFIYIYLLKRIGIPNNFKIVTLSNILIYISFFLIAIFISMPSKDFLTYIFIYFILRILYFNKYSIRKVIFVITCMLIVFAVFFRIYFIFIPFIMFSIYFATKFIGNKNLFIQFLLGIFILIGISLIFGVVNGEYLTSIARDQMNLSREIDGVNSNSIILPPIRPTTWYGEIVSMFYGFFSANFPINEYKHFFTLRILFFIIWQILLLGILYSKYKKLNFTDKTGQKIQIIFLFLFSYFIIQGLFEPDLGSTVRHKIGLFPIIYFLLVYDKLEKKFT